MPRLLLIVLLLCANAAWATSISQPERHDVFSSNGEFVLDVDPATETLTIYKTADRSAPLWSFKRRVWHYPFFLSEDGSVVATTEWEFVRASTGLGADQPATRPIPDLATRKCIEFRNRDGIFKAYTFGDLCPAPLRTDLAGGGPIGDFWRTWYWDAEQEGNRVRIRTTDLWQYTFDLTSGAIVRRRLVAYNLLFKPWFYIGLAICGGAAVIWIARFLRLRSGRNSVGERA